MLILLYILDGLRQDFLGCYSEKENTSPNIDALAKDSVLYTNAYSTTNWTKAAGASILTGQYPRSLKMMYQEDKMPAYPASLPLILKKHGFQTTAVLGNYFISKSFGFGGFDNTFNLQTDKELILKRRKDPIVKRLLGDSVKENEFALPYAEDVNEKIFEVLHERQSKSFILAWSIDTHAPFFIRGKKSYFDNSLNDYIPINTPGVDIKKMKSLYKDMIHYNDEQVGILISKLKAEKMYDNALIIVTSDHGEAFGERRWILRRPFLGHGEAIYEETVKIPLIIKYPRNQFAGKHYSLPAQLTDIYPTILDTLGISIESLNLDGASIRFDRSNNPKRPIFIESWMVKNGPYFGSIKIGSQKLIITNIPQSIKGGLKRKIRNFLERQHYPQYQLFDLAKDPAEKDNLVNQDPETLKDLLSVYEEIKARCDQKARSIEQRTTPGVEKEVKDLLKRLGYFDE